MFFSRTILTALPLLSITVLAEPVKQYAAPPACSKKAASKTTIDGTYLYGPTGTATTISTSPFPTSTDGGDFFPPGTITSLSTLSIITTTTTTTSFIPQTTCTPEQIRSCAGNGCWCDINLQGVAICEGMAFCLGDFPDQPLPPCQSDDDCADLPFFGKSMQRRCVISTDGTCHGQNYCVDTAGCLAFPIVNQKRALEKVFRDARLMKESRRMMVVGQ